MTNEQTPSTKPAAKTAEAPTEKPAAADQQPAPEKKPVNLGGGFHEHRKPLA